MIITKEKKAKMDYEASREGVKIVDYELKNKNERSNTSITFVVLVIYGLAGLFAGYEAHSEIVTRHCIDNFVELGVLTPDSTAQDIVEYCGWTIEEDLKHNYKDLWS